MRDHPESVSALLVRLRREQGKSQQRLADALCARAGHATLTRFEVSRWERGRRLPGGFWRAHLAAVLGMPLDVLEHAVAVQRRVAPVGRA